ncbi:MAG: hypothetical protein ABFR97_09935 [Thermodesulfobacteriota bacterium]
MKKQKVIIITLAILALLLLIWPPILLPGFLYQTIYGWRYPKQWECGDSIVTDIGPIASTRRYLVELGTVSTGQKQITSWELCMLPEEKLFCGISVLLSEKKHWENEQNLASSVVVSMRLYGENNKLVSEKSGSLGRDWTWTPFFGGESVFVYGVPSFTPKNKSKYRLEFEVLSIENSLDLPAKIVLTGGGWK